MKNIIKTFFIQKFIMSNILKFSEIVITISFLFWWEFLENKILFIFITAGYSASVEAWMV